MTTLTTIAGPNNIAPKFKVAEYQLLFDSSYPTGGEVIDLTADFDYIYAIVPCGNDTLADNRYAIAGILPAPTAAVASGNVKISVHLGGTTNQVMEEEGGTTDLSDIGQFGFTVYGS